MNDKKALSFVNNKTDKSIKECHYESYSDQTSQTITSIVYKTQKLVSKAL